MAGADQSDRPPHFWQSHIFGHQKFGHQNFWATTFFRRILLLLDKYFQENLSGLVMENINTGSFSANFLHESLFQTFKMVSFPWNKDSAAHMSYASSLSNIGIGYTNIGYIGINKISAKILSIGKNIEFAKIAVLLFKLRHGASIPWLVGRSVGRSVGWSSTQNWQ
jgi:hypothetical protein